MGWCHEFGPQIHEGCGHPMVAGASSCSCAECGVVCTGRFNGCAAVWARGPVIVSATRTVERDAVALGVDSEVGHVTTADFSLAPIGSLAPTGPPPGPPPAPARAAEPSPPHFDFPRLPARPARKVPAPPPPKGSVLDDDSDRLSLLRARIEGLRGEVKALGDSVGKRAPSTGTPAAESG